MKRLISSIGILALGLMVFSGVSYAGTLQDSDTCLITVQPPTNYSIRIDTPSVNGIDFGTINLQQVKYNTAITTVTNDGSVVSDWKIKVTKLNTWMVDDSNTGMGADGDSTNVGVDTVTISAVLAETSVGVPTDDTYFDTVGDCYDLLKTSLVNMTSDYHSYSTADGDDVPATQQYRLHTRIKGPQSTTDTGVQQFTLTIEAWSEDF